MDADELIDALELEPHPEGGWFRETWRDLPGEGSRGAGTAIYFLLRKGEQSRWHRVDAAEIWHFYQGSPLLLEYEPEPGQPIMAAILGTDLGRGERPQIVIPSGAWQRAWSLGEWTLVGCTVSPAFQFEGFELAPPDTQLPD
ncbi:MAG: cupin domain-containing protein [Candidatus Eisenbacteria bacterium]|uniref:Cupin domain-containing protein n=1 Tax=Eiseniibacteriota bacterium TaxID=2212470 RepID=A0A956SGC7_UNCEI|nr:cupin domain-containing protein [Candidatus Eisenbacteria bacterium]